MFECWLPCFLLLFISFKSILIKVSFQYVQKLLHYVYLLILTMIFLCYRNSRVICSRLWEVVASKVWIPRSKSFSHVDTCWMDFHASSFGPFYFWKFEFWTLRDLHGFKTLFWKYWSFLCYGVDKKTITIWLFSIPMELWYIMVDDRKTFCN